MPICEECGKNFSKTARYQKFCTPVCRLANVKQRRRDEYRIRKTGRTTTPPESHQDHVFVLRDPDLDYGFPRGAALTAFSVKIMLNDGHFTAGTLLQMRGREYQVVGETGQKQALVG